MRLSSVEKEDNYHDNNYENIRNNDIDIDYDGKMMIKVKNTESVCKEGKKKNFAHLHLFSPGPDRCRRRGRWLRRAARRWPGGSRTGSGRAGPRSSGRSAPSAADRKNALPADAPFLRLG